MTASAALQPAHCKIKLFDASRIKQLASLRKHLHTLEKGVGMKVCGVTIKSNVAQLAIVEDTEDGPILVNCGTKKIELADDKNAADIRSFLHSIKTFAHENGIDTFAIKARAHGGQMAGGAVSFKIETLIQLVEDCDCILVNAVALSKFADKNVAGLPAGLLKYQEDAYRCAAYHMHKGGLI
ncbi:MAG TPA: DUF3010 family protein [Devosia sp.]|nr:DUF3010 family protein [Devosia sp.]